MQSSERAQEIKDVEESLKLLVSDEWKQYLQFLEKRKTRLQRDVNAAVRAGNIVQAQIKLGLMDDCTNQTTVFKQQVLQRREDLKKEE